MTDEKWEEITSQIKEKFEILEEKTLPQGIGRVEYLVFKGPLGQMKVERTIKPKVIDKKVYASHRIGGRVREELVYSDSETIQTFKAYKWSEDNDDWVEIEAKNLG